MTTRQGDLIVTNTQLLSLINAAPKAELHLHIEGTLEPSMMLTLAERHGATLPWDTLEAVEEAYAFENLQSFLDLYYLGASVLREAEDFYALTYAYLQRCQAQNVRHLEMMFDPQTHTDRGIEFATVMEGILGAIDQCKRDYDISVELIMCFLRHLDEASALQTLETALHEGVVEKFRQDVRLGLRVEAFQAVASLFRTTTHGLLSRT